MKIDSKYNWVAKLRGLPKMVVEALKLGAIDTTEFSGPKSNPEIMAMANEAVVGKIYPNDEVAWCGVAMVVLALRAGKKVEFTGYDRLRAKSFLKFGTRTYVPMLGDVLVFERSGGFHVGIYIAEDTKAYHVAGGNQSNQFNIIRIEKKRMLQARRPEYSIGVPAGVKRIFVSAQGVLSKNEA